MRITPRRCGENRVNLLRYALLNGSPPRMRGKPVTPIDAITQERITPADAGKTPSDSRLNASW